MSTSTSNAVQPDTLARLEPLTGLGQERLRELAGVSRIELVPRGENPFRNGAADDGAVYLLHGQLLLRYDGGGSFVLVGGHDRALRPLGRFSPRVVAGRAITDVSLLRIDGKALDIMMTWEQITAAPAASAPSANASGQGRGVVWADVPGAFPLPSLTAGAFSHLPAAHIDSLLARFERLKVEAGAVVVREGDEGDYYYLIESGFAQVRRDVGGDPLVLADLKPGDAFGEESLLIDARRNASVVMTTAGSILRLAKADFIELLRKPLLHPLPRGEAEQRVAAGAVWLDVRFPAEFQHEHLPGAINIPLNEIRNAIRVLDRNREYVVCCQSGRRSSAAAFLLSQNGFQAWWLEGGLQGSSSPSE